MINKKKIIIISIVVLLIGIIVGVLVFNNTNNNKNSKTISKYGKGSLGDTSSLSNKEKEIAGIEENDVKNIEDNEETYSDLYKEFLKLPKEEQEKSEVIPRKQEVPFEKLDEIKENLSEQEKNDKIDDSVIPEKFNLADKIDIKVENQGSYGLCWDFASLKALETYLAINNLGNYDLSEMHLDYIESDLLYGYRDIHQGGSFFNFKNYISESGVVLESDVPYREHSEEEYNKFSDMKKVVEVTETVDFPSLYKGTNSNKTDEDIKEFRDTVKRHIMKNGGLYTSVVGTGAKNYYAAIDTPDWSNHAVTIVGWDDNYSKDNFLSSDGKKPSKDGAYIALNSWGTNYNDGGYYYISYEDKYVESNLSGITSTSMDKTYKVSSIKNKAIRDYLKENYGHLFIKYQGEDYITKNVISNIYSLDLSNKGLTSIDGIEIFTNLYELNLSNNNITDITPLNNLDSLMVLNLSDNKLSNISSLANLKSQNLSTINLSNNNIKDVSVLKDINNVENNEYEINISLNISNNKNVIGYDKLNNLWDLNISDCDIKDVSNLKNLTKLSRIDLSNNHNVKGLDNLPDNIHELILNNCDIDSLKDLTKYKNLLELDIQNNKLTSIEGIDEFKILNTLNISQNSITSWDALKDFVKENSYQNEGTEEYGGEFYEGVNIIAQNCNIEDITIFNDLKLPTSLNLENNKIRDLSNFKNDKVDYIDLSGNKDIKGLETLKNTITVFLNNCNLNDLDEILKLENVYDLSLEDNNLADISKLSNLKKLRNLSLANNSSLKGTLDSKDLSILNLSNCNLDNNFDFSKLPSVNYLNISNNPNIKNVSNIVKNFKDDYLTLNIDEIDNDEFEKIKQDRKDYFNLSTNKIKLNAKLDSNNKINLNNNKALKKELMKNFARSPMNIKNGYIDKNISITVEDINKNSVEIYLTGYSYEFPNSIIEIIYNSSNALTNTTTNSINNTNSNTNSNDVFDTNTNINLNTNSNTYMNINTYTNKSVNTFTNISNNTNQSSVNTNNFVNSVY